MDLRDGKRYSFKHQSQTLKLGANKFGYVTEQLCRQEITPVTLKDNMLYSKHHRIRSFFAAVLPGVKVPCLGATSVSSMFIYIYIYIFIYSYMYIYTSNLFKIHKILFFGALSAIICLFKNASILEQILLTSCLEMD